MDRAKNTPSGEPEPGADERADRERATPTDRRPDADRAEPDPPFTTTGPITVPKFGSAGSGGAELEPGPNPGPGRG